MAKFTPGPAVAEVRGSVGGTTFSRNRYGAYMRFRAKPTVSTTEYATLAKARMTAATQAWQELTAAQRLAWNQFGREHPIVGSLGMPQAPTGHAAFVGVHIRCAIMGLAAPTVPPITPPPAPLTSFSVVADKTAGTVNMTFTPNPTGANNCIWVEACQVSSGGISYVENLTRQCSFTGANEASPSDTITRVELRIGTLVIGYTFHIYASLVSNATALISAPLRDTDTIV